MIQPTVAPIHNWLLTRVASRYLYIFLYGGAGLLLVFTMAGCDRTPPTPTPIPVPGIPAAATSLAVVADPSDDSDEQTRMNAGTPTGTPTATPVPSARFEQARKLYRFGDYAAARSELAKLRTTLEPTDPLYIDSQLLLALAYQDEELYNEALVVLEPLIAAADDADRAEAPAIDTATGTVEAQIQMLYAETLNNLGQKDDALIAYTKFLEEHPWSTEIVQSRRGAILLAQGQAADAADAYRDAASVSTNPSSIAFLLETVAQVELGLGRNERAIAAYEGILDVAKRPAYRAQIQYKAGKAAEAAGEERRAIGYWIGATNESVTSNDSHSALFELVNRNVDFNLYQRGLINLNTEVWFPAINAFQAYLDSVPNTDKLAGDAMLGLAQAYIGVGSYGDALTVVNNLFESYPDCSCIGQAWLEKALAQAWLGDSVNAHRTYRTFAREAPENPLASEALWQSGLMAYREGSPLEAAADLLALVDGFPDSERAPLSLYLLGLGAYREGLWDQAALFFQRMVDEYPDEDPADAAYWLGRAYNAKMQNVSSARRTEMDKKARAAWQLAVDTEPGEYYSVLAAVALAQDSPDFNNLLPDVPLVELGAGLSGDDGSRAFAESWLSAWIDEQEDSATGNSNGAARSTAEAPATLGELPAHILSDPNWIQGKFFLELSQRGDALPILERLLDDNADEPATLYALSLAYEEIGAYRLSLIAANNLVTLSPANFIEESPIFIQRLIYPRRFFELVEREAKKHDIDPAVFYSLIRQESLFEEGARSYAAAQGLAQIIPDTGAWVAEKVGYDNYTNALIYRPHINLWFGAYYLDWTRGFLDGNLMAALVGYNAGPGNSQGWLKESGNDDPLFVEILTFSEPRLYVHKITSNYYHYLRLYP